MIIVSLYSAIIFGANLLIFYPLNQTPAQADAIIVLGCAANLDGTPSSILRSRVEKGVRLWREGFANRLIFTGAAVANASVEAEVMADLAVSLGVPTENIVRDVKARSTVENARSTAEILDRLGLKRALVVTSPFHTRRARYLFNNYEYEFIYVAAPYPSDIGLVTKIHLALKDCFKLIFQTVYKTQAQ